MWNSRLPCSSVLHLLPCPPWPSGPGPSQASCPCMADLGTTLSRRLRPSIAASLAGLCSVSLGKLSVDIASARAASKSCSGRQWFISELHTNAVIIGKLQHHKPRNKPRDIRYLFIYIKLPTNFLSCLGILYLDCI